jgi:hypothetical protein
MLSSSELYPVVLDWLHALGFPPHRTAQVALAHLVTALLVAQSLRPAALMRALVSPQPGPARQRYARLALALARPWLSAAWLTPVLVRAALTLVPPARRRGPSGHALLVLDSVRCGGWEVYVLGLAWHGRVLPLAWAVLPYPLPAGRFRPTLLGLLERVAAAWPAEEPVLLLADRAFPSQYLFEWLARHGWDWVIRVRASDGVQRPSGEAVVVRDQLARATVGCWSQEAVQFGRGAHGVPGWLVIGRGLIVVPAYQRGPGSWQHRAAQQAQRARQLAGKKGARSQARLRQTDPWVALFTSLPDGFTAQRGYGLRYHIEGTFRDAQGGWDGQHGWNLEPVLAHTTQAERVEHLVGLWALGTLLQSWLGDQVGAADAPDLVQRVRRQWTTTGRLSVLARGRLALTEPSGWLRAWVLERFAAGAWELGTQLRQRPTPITVLHRTRTASPGAADPSEQAA